MRGAEQGFLLLTSHLGDPNRHPMSLAQLRVLASRVFTDSRQDPDRDLTRQDLIAMGYGGSDAQRILTLLSDEELLAYYTRRAAKNGCVPITPVSADYPQILTEKLGWERPGCLWAKGDLSLLRRQKISLVGSRDLNAENEAFAREVGRQAALQGYVLVSGNARGADRTAQNACLAAGGKVISVIADELSAKQENDSILYLSEDGFDDAFTAQRALSRNRIIHALGAITIAAQCTLGSGGTWDGCTRNLKGNWSDLYVYRDSSEAFRELLLRGASEVDASQICALKHLITPDGNLLSGVV